MKQTGSTISGLVSSGFEAVREAFVENFEHRNELGAACSVYYRTEKVLTFGVACPRQRNRRAMGGGHGVHHYLGHQGARCLDDGARHVRQASRRANARRDWKVKAWQEEVDFLMSIRVADAI